MWQVLVLATVVVSARGHARVWAPPGRATMWRVGFQTPANYDDMGLDCGGVSRQYITNKGKCGICGDAYNIAVPRPHELGGEYGKGIIVANYTSGQSIDVTIEITAFHKGYWYLKLCPDPKLESNQKCFDEHPLRLEDGEIDFFPERQGNYTVRYRLPDGLSCQHCVLQWRYVAGNSWGVCHDGSEAMGCGNQETFGSCSDIRIFPDRHRNVNQKTRKRQGWDSWKITKSKSLGAGLQ